MSKADSMYLNSKKRRESFGLSDREPICPMRRRDSMAKKRITIKERSVSDDGKWECIHYSDGGVVINPIPAKKLEEGRVNKGGLNDATTTQALDAEVRIEVSRIHRLGGTGATKAFADISVNDAFMIIGLRVVEGEKGLFVAMPREEGRDGKWYNVVIPLKRETKDQIEKIVLEAYGA